MKSFKLIMFTCCLMIFGLAFAGCGCNVDQPIVSINGCYAVWQPVTNASGYEIVIDDNPHFNTTDTSVNLITYLQKGNIREIKVRALGKGFFHFNSEYSVSQSVSVAEEHLPSPTGFEVVEANRSYKAVWNPVVIDELEDQINYCLCFIDENGKEYYFQTKLHSFDINGNIGGYGKFKVKVFAYIDDITTLAPSDFCEECEFEYLALTNTVQGVALNKNVLSWNNAAGIDVYNVNLLDGGTISVAADKNSDNNKTSFDITELNTSNKVCVFAGVQAVSSLKEFSSPYSNFYMWYKNGVTKEELSNCKYSYAGTKFDFCADDYNELRTIVHFAIFYRIENLMFTVANDYVPKYGDVSDSSGVCDINYAVKSYAEIMNISYQYSSKTNGYEKFFLSIGFNHPEYARKVTPVEGSYTQFVPKKVNNKTWELPNVSKLTQSDEGYRNAEFDNFPIEDRENEVMVYTSDQLYFVLDKGCKPVFPTGWSPARLAYEAAKDVLRQIVDNTMTEEYQKALAIFEWLCYNVKYDINLYKMANQTDVSNSIHNYRGFYIEGVLFDNGKAVCDGIAKTFSLMCGLENIECYKAIGLVNDGGSHAWNKVKIAVPGNNTKQWYVVDATWSDYTPQNDTTEYLSHRYFLKKDSEVNNHLEALTDGYFDYLQQNRIKINQYELDRRNEGVNFATTEFDYYKKDYYSVNNSCYVDSIEKLNAIKDFILENNLTYFEFKSTVSNSSILGGSPYALAGYECKPCSNAEVKNIYIYYKK